MKKLRILKIERQRKTPPLKSSTHVLSKYDEFEIAFGGRSPLS
ncbi:MAG: hypothetical protein ACR2LR_20190 [Hassallia sp.]